MTGPGFVLVHGYIGSPEHLRPLGRRLAEQHGEDAVTCVRLPGHGEGLPPRFDANAFLAAVAEAIEVQRAAGRRLVLIGHSTGGSLLLTHLARDPREPALLVLAGTPARIDASYAKRWRRHTAGDGGGPPLSEVAALVSLVNGHAKRKQLSSLGCPVLVVQGQDDDLVPVEDADLWTQKRFAGALRVVRVPNAGHELFCGPLAELVADIVCRASVDACSAFVDHEALARLRLLVPDLGPFADAWPDSRRHLTASPAGLAVMGIPFRPALTATHEPTVANIEVTTRCSLRCTACARTSLPVRSRDMSHAQFQHVLDMLPHALRVTLVGLGEPLLHPKIVELVATGAAAGRRISLVTNAMALDRHLARALCDAGLAGITFSIDAVTPDLLAAIRPGSDADRIVENVRAFVEENNRAQRDRRVITSAFTALSARTAGELEAIVDRVADLSLDALMVTDLNFKENRPDSLCESLTAADAKAIRRALKRAVARRLPVLSVHALEEFALEERYREFLLFSAEQLRARVHERTHCVSPWQTIVVGVDGDVTLCDCLPQKKLGNLMREPLSALWNGPAMSEHRRGMLGSSPPAACLICPRF